MVLKYCNENRKVNKLIELITRRSNENKVEFLTRVKKCRSWNDEPFIAKHFNAFMEAYINSPKPNVSSEEFPEVFFSLFMHDWHDPVPNQEYRILNKVRLFCDAAKKIVDEHQKTPEKLQKVVIESANREMTKNNEETQLMRDGSTEETFELNKMSGAEINAFPEIYFEEVTPKRSLEQKANGRNTDTTVVAVGMKTMPFYAELAKIFDRGQHSNYHDVLLRMICLLMEENDKLRASELSEIGNECKNKANSEAAGIPAGGEEIRKKIDENYIAELKHILNSFVGTTFGNRRLQKKVREMVLAFGADYSEVTDAVFAAKLIPSEETESNFMALCRCLINNKVIRFKKFLVSFIDDAKSRFGDYFSIQIYQRVLIASIIAKKLKRHQTCTFITREFPYIGINSTFMMGLNRGLKFRRFKVLKLKNQKFEDWVTFLIFLHIFGRLFRRESTSVSRQINYTVELSNFNFIPQHNAISKGKDSVDQEFVDSVNELGEYLSENQTKDVEGASELNLLVFGRLMSPAGGSGESVYEILLSVAGTKGLINQIWKRFNLNEHPEILYQKNSVGKVLLDYAIESDNDDHLFHFLAPCIENDGFECGKLYMKLLNKRYIKKCGATLIERYVRSVNCKSRLDQKFFVVIFSLLEEIGTIQDVSAEIPEKFLLEIFRDSTDENFETTSFVLAHIAAYCTPNTKGFEQFKECLVNTRESQMFKMIFEMVSQSDNQTFQESFLGDMESVHDFMVSNFANRNNRTVDFLIDIFNWVLIMAAVKNGKTFVIDHILRYNNLANLTLNLPPNMRGSEATEYLAEKMLENGYDLGTHKIPPAWITPEKFREFLDSRIKHEDGGTSFEVDCNFLLDQKTKCSVIASETNIDDEMIFREDILALDFIVNNESLKNFITHPTIATYIDLKMHKFLGIQLTDFFSLFFIISLLFIGVINDSFTVVLLSILFLLARRTFINFLLERFFSDFWFWVRTWIVLFVASGFVLNTFFIHLRPNKESFLISLSFGYLVRTIFRSAQSENFRRITKLSILLMVTVFHVASITTGTFFMTSHLNTILASVFIGIWIASNIIELLLSLKVSSWINLFENLLIDTGVLVLSIFYFTDYFRESWLTFFIVLLFPLCALILIVTLHATIAPLYFMMLKLVWKSFFKAVMAFSVVFISFAVLFHVLFGKIEQDENFFKNFSTALAAFLKVILMTTGEYSVEAFTLQWYHVWIFLAFAATTIVVFNLITGLALDDVQKIRKESRRLTLIANVNFMIKISNFYKNNYKRSMADGNAKKLGINQFRQWILRNGITNYPLLHKIDKIYIKIATKKILFNINGKCRLASTTCTIYSKWIHTALRILQFEDFRINPDAFSYCMKKNNLLLDD